MDRTGEVWIPEGSALECLCDFRRRREAASNHQAAREQLHRRLPQVSTQNDSDDGATCARIIAANERRGRSFEVAICDLNQSLDRRIQSVNYSRMNLTALQEEIARLSSTERAMLIDMLWESLDEAHVKEIDAKWAAESEERINAVDRGELQTIDGPSALKGLRSLLMK